ncbi:LysR family transcriptional regulator [Roseomonas sp. GC11]|uniref:LysR family transcriptional regulator n=1 Tax=Roseomonas sp. GC11 TaxID=2950546 RepID=UPI00210A285E|nr:LysR family transcriptional regulator [Roseomonas sp. GC11]MCQ4161633.1 LysR family transcriptional regulator [Roseomonas sp. GC11]
MNLRFLETFLWVARLNSFSAAAERLCTTQAAVSNRIAALERELGTRLFERDLRSVRLTAEGRAALGQVEEIVRLTQDFRSATSSRRSLVGRLSIGTIDSIVHSWLPALIRRLRETYPGVELELEVDTSLAIAERFQRHELDLALLMGPVTAPQVENIHLGAMACGWYASPAMPFPERPLTVADLAPYDLYAFSRGSMPHQEVLRQFAEAGVQPQMLFTLNSIATMIMLAQDGLGVTILPDIVGLRTPLRRLEVQPGIPPLNLYAAYVNRPRHLLAAKVVAMAREVWQG